MPASDCTRYGTVLCCAVLFCTTATTTTTTIDTMTITITTNTNNDYDDNDANNDNNDNHNIAVCTWPRRTVLYCTVVCGCI